MTRETTKPLVVACPKCTFANVFNQPYAYHAGFGNQGFLYNESGNCTLTWSSYDSDYVAIVGQKHPWMLTASDRERLESSLVSAPDGTRWLFRNPARCLKCGHPISGPITEAIYYLCYDGSVDVDPQPDRSRRFKDVLKQKVEPDGAAHGSQPIRPDKNSTSSASGSRR